MMNLKSSFKSGKWRFGLEWLVVYFLALCICSYFEFQSSHIPESDGYFHIRVATLLREQGFFLKGFPWAWFSMWRDGYSDGCLLYHLFLIPFTYGDPSFGIKFAAVILAAFAFSSFLMILKLNEVKYRYFWLLILVLGGEFFWWRILAPRPQVMSVSFMIWSIHFLLNDKKRPFAILTFFYTFAYVGSFLPLIFAFMRWGYLKVFERRSGYEILMAGMAAYGLGLVLHPYFPKNLLFFYVQNLWVMYFALTQKVNLYLGMEFFPLDTRRLFFPHLPLIFLLLTALFAGVHRRTFFSVRTRVLFPWAIFLIFMTFISKRFTEYSIPVTTLFCALASTDVVQDFSFRDLYRRYRIPVQIFVLFWVAFLGLWTYRWQRVVRSDFLTVGPSRLEELSRVIAQAAPANEIIYTCDWDEPPELFYFNPQYRYLVMMDPTFMYYWNPDLWQSWFNVSNLVLSPEQTIWTLKEKFKTRFGVCGSKFQGFHQLAKSSPHFRILKETRDGFAFELL